MFCCLSSALSAFALSVAIFVVSVLDCVCVQVHEECAVHLTCEECIEAQCEFDETFPGPIKCVPPSYVVGTMRVVRHVISSGQAIKCPPISTAESAIVFKNHHFDAGLGLSLETPPQPSKRLFSDERIQEIQPHQYYQILVILTLGQWTVVMLLVVISIALVLVTNQLLQSTQRTPAPNTNVV